MNAREYISKMKNIQNSLLKFVEDKANVEENYENFKKILHNHQITEDKHEMKLLLRLINTISNNHHRVPNFIEKMERILKDFKFKIINRFSNSEIYELFEMNKRMLLFLFKEGFIHVDVNIFTRITSNEYVKYKYPQYFYPEIKQFLTDKFIEDYRKSHYDCDWIEEIKKELPEDFENKRIEGENEFLMCKLIRMQQTNDFIVYMYKEGLPFDSVIKKSIFETNPYLFDNKDVTVMEYASFFGSLEIINFLIMRGVEQLPSIWIYSVHSENSQLIQFLENRKSFPQDNSYKEILEESIKCHHNELSKYITSYLIKEEDLAYDNENVFDNNLYRYSVEYDNYCFFPFDINHKFLFHYLCEFDYYMLVYIFLRTGNVNVNATAI